MCFLVAPSCVCVLHSVFIFLSVLSLWDFCMMDTWKDAERYSLSRTSSIASMRHLLDGSLSHDESIKGNIQKHVDPFLLYGQVGWCGSLLSPHGLAGRGVW